MQIQGINTDQVYAVIGNYIDKGWHQITLGAHDASMNRIVNTINNSSSFQKILQSNDVGINALHLSDSHEFLVSLVFNPSKTKAIELTRNILNEFRQMNVFYGKQLLSKYTGIENLIDTDLQKLIDSFWDKPNAGLALLSFLIPPLGLLLSLIVRKKSPKKALSCVKGTVFGVLIPVAAFAVYYFIIR